MTATNLLLVDPNTFRGSAFVALLAPWAVRCGAELHVVQDVSETTDLSGLDIAACLINVGGMSLSDRDVIRTTDALQELYPDVPLIVLSDVSDPFEVDIALDNKLQGFIPTTMPTHVALAAVQFILNGGTYHPHALPVNRQAAARTLGTQRGAVADTRPLAEPDGQEPATNLVPLKKMRHVEVLRYLAQGETNKEIARRLKLTEATVKVYVRELMHHFGAKNRMQVALHALAIDPVDPPHAPAQANGAALSQLHA